MPYFNDINNAVRALHYHYGKGDIKENDIMSMPQLHEAIILANSATKIYHACRVAALWSTVDDQGEPLDETYDTDDLNNTGFDTFTAVFLASNEADCAEWIELYGEESLGHDIWLTSQGHGAGFWDRGAGELGERLTEACRACGFANTSLVVGDDGKLYL